MKHRNAVISVILIGLAIGTVSFAVVLHQRQVGTTSGVGTMVVQAWYATPSGVDNEYVGSYRIVLVTVSGPQSASGTTTTDPRNPLTLNLTAGTYTVSGTYYAGNFPIFRYIYVTVDQGETVLAFLSFGSGPPPP